MLDGAGWTPGAARPEITEWHKHLIRPDGYGWVEHGRRLGFYLEYDTGTEMLATVVKKLDDFAALEWGDPSLAGMVLFSVATARREAGPRAGLAAKHCPIPIATTARDHPNGPAGPVWAIVADGAHGGTARANTWPAGRPDRRYRRRRQTGCARPGMPGRLGHGGP